MKHSGFLALAVAFVLPLFFAGCAREELPDNRETQYGYVQFKLYKEGPSGSGTKAVTDRLDYLSQAGKVRVELINGDQTIAQTLTLSASDSEAAEFGLRSSKLKLLAGDYSVAAFTLYDVMDEELYMGSSSGTLTVVPGGLTVYDLSAATRGRGKVRFRLVKDMEGFNPPVKSSATSRQYTFDEIASVDLTLRNEESVSEIIEVTGLQVEFSEHFRDDENYEGQSGVQGFQTSSSQCDSLVSVPAGTYKVIRYLTYDSDGVLLETRSLENSEIASAQSFTVQDNVTTDADVAVALYEADEYMKDNYALYAIWKALDGENWSYEGQNYALGTNWDFNKDPDLWCDQPGVQVHSNGRIASLNFSGFGISGKMPAAIGQLTALVQLTFGDHNETKQFVGDPFPVTGSSADKSQWRQRYYKAYSRQLHPGVQMSPVCALALREHGLTSAAASSYEGMGPDEISRMASGERPVSSLHVNKYDMNHGVKTNGFLGFAPDAFEAVGRLTGLESMSIANSPVTADAFPGADVMSRLVSLTDLEIYNCPELESLPEGIAALPALITVNISNNEFEASAAYDALDALASGSSRNNIQILYFLQNGLEALPRSVGGMAMLGMLDLAQNNITGPLPSLGTGFTPEDVNFDYNKITSVPDDFCSYEYLDNFSVNYNELTEFPNIFEADADIIASSISVAYNKITRFPTAEDGFKGLRTVSLVLSGNDIDEFPKGLSQTDSYVETLVLSLCGMSRFPKGCLDGKYTSSITTLDLTYNDLTDLPEDLSAESMPYLYGCDLSYNNFSSFPLEPLNVLRLTAFGIRGQRNDNGERCLRSWPTGLYTHTGMRGFYIGSNDLRVINDEISYLIYYLDISDNPNITFDASDICYYWRAGAYILYYDKTQNIINCDEMLE